MKVLMIFLSCGWPANTPVGISGGDKHFMEICKGLLKDGSKVHVLTNEAGAKLLNIEGIRVPTYILRIPFDGTLYGGAFGTTISYLLRTFKALFRLTYLPRNFNMICAVSNFIPDIITLYIAWRICNFRARPIVFFHGPLVPPPMLRRWYHPLLSSFLAWISQILSISLINHFNFHVFATPFAGEQLKKTKLSKNKIELIYNGVDIKSIQNVSPAEEKYDACFLGGLLSKKGIFDLVDVWQLVCEKIPNAKLALIGTGPEKQLLERKVNSKNLENNIFILGYLQEGEKIATLKGSTVFLFPSREESWGISICEAMACGLPVVAYDLPAYQVFGDAIVKVSKGNIDAFASAVLSLLSDDELRRAVGEKAKTIANRFDWSKIAKEEMALLQNLIKAQ